MTTSAKLRSLVTAVPWLGELPPEVLRELDVGELHVPRGGVAVVRRALEVVLRVRVMTYQVPPPPPAGRELCQSVPVARLWPWQRAVLRAAELLVARRGVVFCAYAPLRPPPAY